MQVSGVTDLTTYLIQQAVANSGQQVHQRIQVAVLKQALDQQKVAGEAVVRLINSTPGQNTAPGRVDIRV
jgi:hypothetical protein